VLFLQAAAYIQNKRKLDEAEALLGGISSCRLRLKIRRAGKPQRY
jgi:hypothetical protein